MDRLNAIVRFVLSLGNMSNVLHRNKRGPSRGFGDLGRRAIYFQGAGEHCLLF